MRTSRMRACVLLYARRRCRACSSCPSTDCSPLAAAPDGDAGAVFPHHAASAVHFDGVLPFLAAHERVAVGKAAGHAGSLQFGLPDFLAVGIVFDNSALTVEG